METIIEPISSGDREAIIDIFNYYIENSFAAYPENTLPYEAFDTFLQFSEGLPTGAIKDRDGKVIGFGMLRYHNKWPVFSHTVEAAYFLHPDFTGKGLGDKILEFLEMRAVEQGITNILAHISSLNPRSIRFHQKNGFVECGRFIQVGRKNGQEFDTVWMQKRI